MTTQITKYTSLYVIFCNSSGCLFSAATKRQVCIRHPIIGIHVILHDRGYTTVWILNGHYVITSLEPLRCNILLVCDIRMHIVHVYYGYL